MGITGFRIASNMFKRMEFPVKTQHIDSCHVCSWYFKLSTHHETWREEVSQLQGGLVRAENDRL